MKNISFTPTSFSEYNDWLAENPAIATKIIELIRSISNDSFKGIGKPEPLKGNYKGLWSRRITQEHRLIYKVQGDTIFVLKCKGHYE